MDTHFVQRYDTRRNFQYVNDEPSVLHCHHYAAQFTKLAMDQAEIGGPLLLAEAMEESFYLVLKKYFIRYKIQEEKERRRISEEYYSLTGMGSMSIASESFRSGTVRLSSSHIDEGWKKKWGPSPVPVNYMTCGYIAACFSVIYGKPVDFYFVTEDKSLVRGDRYSEFSVIVKGEGDD